MKNEDNELIPVITVMG